MFVGAVSVAYLLKLGYPPSTVAFLKLVQSVVVLLGEFPSGVISDFFGRKLSLLWSVVSSALGFLCFMHGAHIAVLIVGEALLALALCLWSGSYEAWALEVGKVRDEDIKEFFHTNSSLNQFSVLTAGLLGGIIAGQEGLYRYAYLASFLSMAFLFAFLLIAPRGGSNRQRRDKTTASSVIMSLVADAKTSISVVSSTRALVSAMVLMVAAQFSVQPMLHYWQPLVSTVFGENGVVFGIFFAAFCGGSAIVSWIFRKSPFDNSLRLFFVWTLLLAFVGLSHNKFFVSVTLIASQVTYFFLKSIIGSHVAANAPAEYRASILSFTSLISRAGMLGSLLAMAIVLEFFEADGAGVRLLYVLIPALSCLGLLIARLMSGRGQRVDSVVYQRVNEIRAK